MNDQSCSPLWAWAEKLPDWQSDLLRRLTERAELTEQDADEVLANLDADLSSASSGLLRSGRRLQKDDLPSSASAAGSVRLVALRDVQRAGALRKDATLTFAPAGLTVVYGDNGAGKTTFARLLKQACRARVREDHVHPNVFIDEASGAQTYTLEVTRDGATERLPRKVGDGPDPALGSISIFDAACADHYVAKGDEPAYVPREVQLLERLGRAQKQLRDRVAEQKRMLAGALPDFSSLPPATAIARAMAGDDLDPKTVERLAHVDQPALARLSHLEELLESTALNAERLAAREGELKRLTLLRQQLVTLAERSSDAAISRWRGIVRDANELAAALTALGGRLEGLPLGPVGTPAWMALWHAAHTFFAQSANGAAWGEHCPLCQRPMDTPARERFDTFTALASDQLKRDHDSARRAAQGLRSELELARADAAALERMMDGAESWRACVRVFVAGIGARLADALEGRESAAHDEPPIAEIDAAIGECQAAIGEIVALQDRNELADRCHERDELLARRQLSERRDDALRRASMLTRMRELDAVHGELATNALSRAQTKLTTQLVTDRLRQELERGREELGVRHLRVELAPGAKQGRAFVGLALPRKSKVKIEEVFSGGERRTLALAFFLAEIAAADHDGTIVLDDPVSSLDADRRLYVARRLLEEAQRRQVIVFTHDPHLLILLRRERKSVPMTVRTCSNMNGTAGHVTDEEPWTTSPASALVGKLRTRFLKEARKHDAEGNVDAYGQAVDALLKRLRKAWERAVAELFRGVVEPGSFEVHTKKLHEIVITDELVEAVRAGMGALSFDAHDQGVYMAQMLPRIEDLEGHIQQLERFLALVADARTRVRSGHSTGATPPSS